jgi:hypothetical protein
MSKLQEFFHHIIDSVKKAFKKNLPEGFEHITETIILGLNKAKALEESNAAHTIASLFGNVGEEILEKIHGIIPEILPVVEMAKGAEEATHGLSGVDLVNALLTFILNNIKNLPSDWQGKHWLDVASRILQKVLNITHSEAVTLVQNKFLEMNSTKA